ncbi:MAG: outer membrane beta-barrel protein [Bacteroidota bacterium]
MRNFLNKDSWKTTILFCTLVLVISLSSLRAQELSASAILHATIIDQEGNAIPAGNIYLLAAHDSAFVTGTAFLDGDCRLQTSVFGEFLLKIQSLGYQPSFEPIRFSAKDSSLEVGNITLMPLQLAEVVISAQENVFEENGEGFIFKVAKSSYRNMGTALDLLRSTPKVFTNSAGQVAVLGKGRTNIYLDGQLITSPQLLSNLSSTDIIRIEVIENPGAQYDASANAVINIITSKKRLQGYEVDLVQEVGKGKYTRSYYQAKGYARNDKLSLQLGYGLRPWTWGGRNHQFRNHSFQGDAYQIDSRFRYKNERMDQDIQLKGSVALSPKASLHFQYMGIAIDGDRLGTNKRGSFVNTLPSLTINASLNGPYQQWTHTYNLQYVQQLDTLGSSLTAAVQRSDFTFSRQENILQDVIDEGIPSLIDRNSVNENDIQIHTAQLDYRKVFSKGGSWQSGLKYVDIGNSSKVALFDRKGIAEVPLADFSNQYSYDERILAAYTSLSWQLADWNIQTGLRLEHSLNEGLSLQNGEEIKFESTYTDLFPSLSLKKKINKQLSTSFNYQYKISRPQFQDLNPYVLYVDSLVSLRGNPQLVPAYVHNISASLSIKKLAINLSYVYARNPVNQVFRSTDESNPAVIAFVKENLLRTTLYNASVSLPLNKGSYAGYISLGSFLDDHQTRDIVEVLSNRKPGFYLQMNHSVILPWKLKADLMVNYTSSRVDGVYTDNPISFVNIALSRLFFQEKLRVQIWANDIFDNYKFTGITRFNAMEADYLSEGDWHFIKVSLNWNFGKLGASKLGDSRISRQELSRISQGGN